MLHERLSLVSAREKRGRLLMVCVLSLLCLSQAALAQSGRRQIKREPQPPPPTVNAEAKPEATPEKEKLPPVASFVVGGDRLSATFEIPTGYLDIAINACIDRLRKSQSLDVKAGGTSLNRKEAIDEAKKQTEAYVVWLELKADISGSSLSSIVIQYSVFTPQTAKVKTYGSVYLDERRMGSGRVGVGLPPSTSRRLPLDYLMREGGRDVAERLMNHFHVRLPD
jgi:hypothetical protein